MPNSDEHMEDCSNCYEPKEVCTCGYLCTCGNLGELPDNVKFYPCRGNQEAFLTVYDAGNDYIDILINRSDAQKLVDVLTNWINKSSQ